MRRWIYLIFAAAAMMFMGLVEGWSIFILPLEHKFPGWSLTQLSVTLSLTELGFCSRRVHMRVLKEKIHAANDHDLCGVYDVYRLVRPVAS